MKTGENKLDEICNQKREHITAQKIKVPLSDIREIAANMPTPRGFLRRLQGIEGTALIAEIKKASPSKGVIRADFNPLEIAKIYEESGAACLSVLTDIPYFQGHDSYLVQVREQTALPLLRKDFMVDPYQIYESRALGADCILLIMAALDDELARELYALAVDLGMDVLVEVHDLAELERALMLNPMMIGVNNRNLKTLSVDLETSITLGVRIPPSVFKISESGISDSATIHKLQHHGYNAFLVGESLMRMPNIAEATRALLE